MRLKIVEKEENSFLNPEFLREKTLRLEFAGNSIFAPCETDLIQLTAHAAKYACAVGSVYAFSSGNSLLGFCLASFPVMDVYTRSTKIFHSPEDSDLGKQDTPNREP